MRILILVVSLFAMCLAACEKQELECKNCKVFYEDNIKEATLKAFGITNNYPAGYKIESQEDLGLVCGQTIWSENVIVEVGSVKNLLRRTDYSYDEWNSIQDVSYTKRARRVCL